MKCVCLELFPSKRKWVLSKLLILSPQLHSWEWVHSLRDYFVIMGWEEKELAVLLENVIEWNIPDPKGKSIDIFREIRNRIENKVRDLFKENE